MTAVLPAPAIILVEPQLGENIGAAARAMLNCGLTDLRLVKPRDGWPSEAARANSAGALSVIDSARLFDSVEQAIADLTLVFATTARSRDMTKVVITPDAAALQLHQAAQRGADSGILFGRERSGLTNDEVTLADAALTFPLNPEFSSLNLAQAVLLIGWEWRRVLGQNPPAQEAEFDQPAPKEKLFRLFEHLEEELDRSNFFFPPEKRPHVVRNLRNLLGRAGLNEHDVRMLHGVIRSLSRQR